LERLLWSKPCRLAPGDQGRHKRRTRFSGRVEEKLEGSDAQYGGHDISIVGRTRHHLPCRYKLSSAIYYFRPFKIRQAVEIRKQNEALTVDAVSYGK